VVAGGNERGRGWDFPEVKSEGSEGLPVQVPGYGPGLFDRGSQPSGNGGIVQQANEQVIGSHTPVTASARFFTGAQDRGLYCSGCLAEHSRLLAVLGVDRLAGYAEGVSDLFPRPARRACCCHLLRFHLLGQPAQRTYRS
jgi:hypothetical protein